MAKELATISTETW